MDDKLPIVFGEDGEAFEHLAKENGKRIWSARILMQPLGYDKWPVFKKVIEKAIAACALLGHSIFEHFVPVEVQIDGRLVEDFELSRFACFMTVLNADSSNRNVAAVQAHLVSIAELYANQTIEHAQSMDRLAMREEISEREITLRETAARADVESHANFRTAGYIGMYEMDYQSLRELRGLAQLPKRSLLDFMGKDELAANLFRLSLTEGRIRRDGTRGQAPLEKVAREVGQRVRHMVIEEFGVRPEALPVAQDIKLVKKGLKRAGSELGALDDLNKQRETEAQFFSELPGPVDEAVPGCSECAAGNPAPHNGSPNCTSGSLASGGTVAHCTCEYCY